MNITVQFYGNAIHPTGASSWGMRLQIALLYPKLSQEQKQKIASSRGGT